MTRPISWSMRFALALSAIFSMGTLVAGGMSYVLLSRELTQRLTADTMASARNLAQIAAEGHPGDLDAFIAAQARSVPDASSLVAHVDDAGTVTGSLRLTTPFEGVRRIVVGTDIPDPLPPGIEGPDAYLAYGIRIPDGWVIAARDEDWVAENGEILVQTLAVALSIGLILSIGLAVIFARRNERRIDAMESALDAVGAGQLAIRIGDEGADDLAELARRVDGMLDRLEIGVDAIRQVTTDVAHDLRAPLTRLRMRLEPQALSQDLPADVRHEIGSALVDIDAMSATFDAILRLARLQSGTADHANGPVDLGRLAGDLAEILEPSAEEAGHTLTFTQPDDPVVVSGDADLLAQVIGNLVDNALRHSLAPARVLVRVAHEDGYPVLSVGDDGPGIAESDRDRVLDRFVRLDASRSVPGTGLGLSLVAAIAGLHGARLQLLDNAPGLVVRLVFPKAEAAR
ncbi:sensor histidine kinase [Chachezhania sediminis]|uniref:sensor histidine kinase n=1 Tax=Chachezhania sediminis TaxID=2599291 RepID=UPI001E59E292|nr:HAMP domain-containing sensor histidine kinase [Chachezhania sediminis]